MERRTREQVVQDGFSWSVSGSVPEAAPARPPVREVRRSVLELADNGDGTLTVLRCLDPDLDDCNIAFEAGNRQVSVIAPRAFENCRKLQRLILPEGLVSIGEKAFNGCASLHRLTVPGSVQKIGSLAFARCTMLQQVRIDPGVSAIGPSAFSKCTALLRVDMPESVQSFGGGVFFGCGKGLCLYGASGTRAEEYARINGLRYDSEDWMRDAVLRLAANEDGTLTVLGANEKAGNRLEIPGELCGRRIVAIAGKAFYDAQFLEQIILGQNIKYIGESAFMGCRNLSLAAFTAGVERIDENAFAGCIRLQQLILPAGTGSIGRMAFFGCSHLSFVRMPAGTRIEQMAFEGCSQELRVYGGVPVSLI